MHHYSAGEAGGEMLGGKPDDGGAYSPFLLPQRPPHLNPEFGVKRRGALSGRRSTTHHYHYGEHSAAFTLKLEEGRGLSEFTSWCVFLCDHTIQ